MISKNRISELRKLHLKKFRDESRLFIVEGRKSVEMLLASHFAIREILTSEQFAQSHRSMLAGHPVTIVATSDLERITALNTSPELLAVVEQPRDLGLLNDDVPVVVLDRIADPGNMGTIIRTADWFGIRQVVCSPDCVELYNPKTIQATMGSFCHVKVWYQPLVPFLQKQRESRRVIGAFLNGESVRSFEFLRNDVLVIGSESHGISPDVEKCITHRITIPDGNAGAPTAESLNAGVAAAILMFQMM